jgi:cell division protein FtsN
VTRRPAPRAARGGFLIGLVIGLLVGLVLALGVALYVTKVPVPFVNKVPQRTPEQDAAEAERNRNWDPNAGLGGRAASRPAGTPATPAPAAAPPVVSATPAPGAALPPPAPPAPTTAPPPPTATAPSPAPRDPAAILGEKPQVGTAGTSAAPAVDPFVYFVQAGAYARPEDAEQQRARLGMLGFEARLSEREQSGRTMYRVRVGPFDKREAAEAAKDKLHGSGIDAALVRVQK